MVLCNPYNPLGRVMEPAELDAIAAVVDRHGGRVFADEIHAPLVYPGHRHVPYRDPLRGHRRPHRHGDIDVQGVEPARASKCAQLIVNEADRAHLESLGPYAINSASTFGVLASTAAFTHGRPWLADIVAYLDGNRRLLADLLAAHLPDVGYTPPEGHVPDVARLPSPRPARRPGRVLPAARRRGGRRRGAVRHARPRVRAPQHRHQPADPHPGRRADGGRRAAARLSRHAAARPRRSARAAPRPDRASPPARHRSPPPAGRRGVGEQPGGRVGDARTR